MADQEAFQAAADWLSTSPAAAQLTNEAKLEVCQRDRPTADDFSCTDYTK
jgi:hypothetical protein